ncbi:chromosome segregation protein SMC [Mesorhizobium sp. M4B.F.Ca.ET.215.01.1.1]|uniref:chromosome segregation protein SMC n=1 Tax=unclassified Mesorhizobium TaxID=325217 RepID=UPI00109229DB|nr:MULTISPECIES: chromosome segregation protein SMC [unclassified Mesorhizobium]TGQ18870.1 chromosome segregation protein SMC [Mesorhizobium sp. M4B.F.Ca.ET.215.01.1.1]TGQ48874.1 chromosome segregation protein SMC [Mesorhizobium sp. M00.F.Ca.ET.220.01.1.1]TGR09781.1 chromosome segregation protein SMC [Mesorhizobium sp. M4B.F.Ca.ET.203.01.1.1]TGR15164.1 chromosome segregation protein SMC [Mesorhizobium sp. M4B.F.Ca.ET.200.01.1.1]TGS23038.1 chromosome segregation protein SMC [Mesorhizobium sp. M
MKFSRLRLLGFKSFVEPGEFVIERGLTGIVGPNGCGKSNLVEALRWVMGESSYKNMRASGMDDVIFSGSGTRPARNTAEVTLFLDNTDRTAPAAFNDADELQVSRRIEREAGSLYRINGKEARAKDVQLLFADQSTGARSPSMVGQGRIGELIQAKPQARRALLEEAAGISGLHTRRHEAELRLKAAEQNLERLDDVVGELESQIDSLKRQARQASRFKNLSADIRKAEATLLHLRWTLAKTQEGEARSALAAATTLVGDRAAAQMAAAREQGIGAHRLPDLRDAEAAAAAAFQRLSIAKTQIEEEAGRIRSRQAELERRLQQLDGDIAREERMVRDNADILERLRTEEASLNSENAGAAEREATTRAAFEQAGATLAQSEAKLAALTAERAEAAASRHQIERTLRETAERRDRFARQLAEVDRELSDIVARISGLPDPAEKRLLVEDAAARLEESEAGAIAAEQAVAEARGAESAARPPLQDAKAELQRIETEARTLSKILNAASGDLFPSVLEQLSVERGYETALGAALGEDLDVPLDRSAPVHWGESAVQPGDAALPEGVKSLASVVRAPSQLARRLAQIGIVEAADGRRLQALLAPGQRLVSRDGALWRWDGLTASADAPTAAAQRLAQKNRLAELDAEAVQATRVLREAEAALAQAEQALRQASEEERNARQAGRDAQHGLDAARNALAEAEKAGGELVSRRAALDEARARVVDSHEETQAAFVEAEMLLQDAPDLGDLQLQLEQSSANVSRDRATLADARAVHEGLRREAEARTRRLEAIGAERRNWLERAENASTQIAALGERRAEAEAERERLADAPDEIDAKRRALLSQLTEAETLRQAAADRLQEAENRQAELDKAATAAIQSLAEARETRVRAEERLTAADERRLEVEARIQETLNTPPHLVIRHTGLEADDPMPEMAEVERQLDRLKVERERLGAVNLRAEEEQKELSDRLETIVSEREDIIEAIRKLRQAIQSLNREGRERLLSAFEVVNGHFQRLFSHLFGGGTAELQLIESEDPLEAGLEILARPPGKKPQTMTLLSGGEQALTAMSLIFAVFLTNPAPICVLDEVDAPLDDHNVERFCNLMDEMSRTTETRFVIITHNPITMARMDRLFGVTMAEQGVSQLVSVDLQAAEAMREAS